MGGSSSEGGGGVILKTSSTKIKLTGNCWQSVHSEGSLRQKASGEREWAKERERDLRGGGRG